MLHFRLLILPFLHQIDFQMGYYGSMGIDYNYFITLSSNNAVKSNNRDSLLEAYYLSMTQALTDNNYPKAKIPTLKNVQDEVANNEFYGMFRITLYVYH